MSARVVVGVSGASGAPIAAALVRELAACGAEIHLVVSRAAERTFAQEIGPDALAETARRAFARHAIDDIGAAIASGAFSTGGMIVAPCSMRTLSAIAHSAADNLIVRAADVHLKERRKLILLTRESPLHLGHIRAMAAATEIGAVVMPPAPAYYLKPATLDDMTMQIARRAIDLLGLFAPRAHEWRPDD